jgi:hypothetical protein
LTCDKSPVRESRTPGSVGEVPGNRHLYPTINFEGQSFSLSRITCLEPVPNLALTLDAEPYPIRAVRRALEHYVRQLGALL